SARVAPAANPRVLATNARVSHVLSLVASNSPAASPVSPTISTAVPTDESERSASAPMTMAKAATTTIANPATAKPWSVATRPSCPPLAAANATPVSAMHPAVMMVAYAGRNDATRPAKNAIAPTHTAAASAKIDADRVVAAQPVAESAGTTV